MKVEFETENYSPIRRHSRRNSFHRCSPYSDSNLATLNRAAEYFRLNQVFTGVELSRNTKQNSKRTSGCWDNKKWPRKLRITVSGGSRAKSPSLIRALECFRPLQVFLVLNWSQNTKKDSKGVSGCREKCVTLQLTVGRCNGAVATFFLSFLGNRWQHSSPVSIFLTDSTPKITTKAENVPQLESETAILNVSLLASACMRVLCLPFLNSKCLPFLNSASWFWTRTDPFKLNAHEG